MKKVLLLLACSLLLVACQTQDKNDEVKPTITEPQEHTTETTTVPPTATEKQAEVENQVPPTPPLSEDFQGKPQLSLFPRAGAFRPELDDTEGLKFWRTYIDHLMRTSGPIKTDTKPEGNLAFSFRAIKGLDSVGVFSPIAVKPATSYEVTASLTCDLTEGATAGIGLLEFDKFMWIGEQYPESLIKESQTGTQQLVSLSGRTEQKVETFTFTTGPKTAMIHLVFFRDGAHDRNPVQIDDIGIKKVSLEK